MGWKSVERLGNTMLCLILGTTLSFAIGTENLMVALGLFCGLTALFTILHEGFIRIAKAIEASSNSPKLKEDLAVSKR